MEVIYAPKAIEHLNYCKKSGNKAIQKKIEQLINNILEHPHWARQTRSCIFIN